MADRLPQPWRRRSDDRWCAPYYDSTGRRRVAYGATVEDAVAKRDRVVRGYDDRQTLGQWLGWWTGTHLPRRVRDGRIAPSTANGYAAKARLYIIGSDLADVPLGRLAAQHVEDWLEDLAATVSERTGEPLSGRTREAAHAALRNALSVAERHGLVERNVARLVEAPSADSAERLWLTPRQARVFIQATRGDRFEALWRVVLPLGLRAGEGLAITPDAIDLEAGTVAIDRNLVSVVVDGQRLWQHKGTKTHASATLALPRFALESLARRLEVRELEAAMAGPAWTDAPAMVDERLRPVRRRLLFCGYDGRPLHTSNVSRPLGDLCESAGLPRLTPHGLRHSCASILAAQGASLLDIQKLLRHRRQALTSDLYAHLVDEVQRAHVEGMDELADDGG